MCSTEMSPERKVEILPMMLPIGEDGRVEAFIVDDDFNAISRRSYCNGKLFRELLYPFGVQVPGWSLNGKLCKVTITENVVFVFPVVVFGLHGQPTIRV